MDRLTATVRCFALIGAFVAVMALAGALAGGVGGLALVLLTHTVLGLGVGVVELMPVSLGLGIAGFAGLGVFLALPYTPRPQRSMRQKKTAPTEVGLAAQEAA